MVDFLTEPSVNSKLFCIGVFVGFVPDWHAHVSSGPMVDVGICCGCGDPSDSIFLMLLLSFLFVCGVYMTVYILILYSCVLIRQNVYYLIHNLTVMFVKVCGGAYSSIMDSAVSAVSGGEFELCGVSEFMSISCNCSSFN